MGLRETFLNMLDKSSDVKQDNSALRSARDFLVNGNRGDRLYPTWSDIKMPDSDMYSGYSYAVIQKRGNKVSTLARTNLKTLANDEIVDEYQKKNEAIVHPYLKLIEESTDFTEKQFWKNISIYLDLAGRYYLAVIRNRITPLNPNLPAITTDPTKFIMLNPYEIKRVVDKNKNVAGYIERKKDGRYREWPLHQIIEFRELNPFDPDAGHWAMTDAAKDAVYTINQSGDYTRQSLNGNIDAPGIITTDVLLNDNDFANFRARVTQHKKGEPLFGNGTGAISWDAMQIDLDKAALLDINEINRTTLFAVSGTSKTSLGIEQSGTTRETANVQRDQFISDTAQPRLEDIVDFLNLDYKKYYAREYKQTGYKIEVTSAVGRDYDAETKATALKQSQFQLAMSLIQSGYTQESAWQFANGEIEYEDLELEKGLDKPKNPEEPSEEEGSNENSPNSPKNSPQSGSGGGDGSNSGSENNSLEMADFDAQDKDVLTTDLNELEPHSELVENGGKGSGNFGHRGRPGEIGGSGKGGISEGSSREDSVFDNPWDAGDNYWRPLWDAQLDSKQTYSEYYRDAKDRATKVIEIDPEVYLDILQKGGHSRDMTHEGLRRDNPDSIEFHRSKIRNNESITTPTVLIESDGRTIKDQEGRHRLEAAILEGVKKVPVMVGYHPSGADINQFLSGFDYKDITDNYKKLVNKHFGKETSNNSVEGENSHPLACTCEHDHRIETFINEVAQDDEKVVNEAYKEFLKEVREIEKETIDACARKVDINAFEESDIIGKRKKKSLVEKLKNAIRGYWWAIFPLFASNSMNRRNEEFGEDVQFVFNNELQAGVNDNAEKVAEGHMETILGDVLDASNKAYTNVSEEAAAELIIEAYKVNPEKYKDYFDYQPTMADALSSIRRTDILETNKKIYEKAYKMAFEGYNRRDIIKAIRNEYRFISEKRATLIAENETDRAFGRSQYEADRQFLNSVGKLENAYKIWYSRRPASEQDRICDFCAELIRRSNENPVPFNEPFVAFGDSMEVTTNDGKVKIYTANYEDIQGNSLHPRCMCGYKLVFKNDAGEFVKTLNGGKGSGNFGHSGRPGEVGGSGKSNTHNISTGEELFNAKIDNKIELFNELSMEEKAKFIDKALELEEKDVPAELQGNNSEFQAVSLALNNNKKPTVLDADEFDKKVKDGELTELWRMVNGDKEHPSKDMALQLQDGQYTYQGKGVVSGTYFAFNKDSAEIYMSAWDHTLIQGGLQKKCKVLDIVGGGDQYLNTAFGKETQQLEQLTGLKNSDSIAILALAKGYDAVRFNTDGETGRRTFGDDSDYICFLKRDNLVLRRNDD